MPRGASNSSRSSDENQERLTDSKHGARRISQGRGNSAVEFYRDVAESSADITEDIDSNESFSRTGPFIAATSLELQAQPRESQDSAPAASLRSNPEGSDFIMTSGSRGHDRVPLPILPQSRDSSHPVEIPYTRTGFSDDGRSLTPEPQSSEAETEHIISEDDAGSQHSFTNEIDENSEDELYANEDEEIMEVPEDLDNLSDTDSQADAHESPRPHSVVDVAENVLAEEEVEEEAKPQSSPHSSDISSANEQINGADIIASLAAALPTSVESRVSPSSPPRKRKRSSDVSPIINSKRLAPRKVAADLDSDEEEADSRSEKFPGQTLSDDEGVHESRTDVLLEAVVEDSQDLIEANGNISEDVKSFQEMITDPATTLEEEEEEEVEEDEDEPEEEVQDDTEREERNRHRKAAMDALRQIETDFCRLRAKLYEERMTQIEREIAMADSCQHPLLIEKAQQNSRRHAGRISRAKVLRERRNVEAELEFKAQKFMAHSQFAQDKQKLRGTLLSKTSSEWFQIHREKRVLDMAVPEYGYVLSERKSVQAKQRREFEAEVNILAGLKKFVGFPAAPPIPVASVKEIDADLSEMGILRNTGSANRDSYRTGHHVHLSPHVHTSAATHPNHAHATPHLHGAHQTSHNKVHHHRKQARIPQGNDNLIDHHVSVNHNQQKIASPQVAVHQQFHAHAYHPEAPSRKSIALPATFANTNEQDRKPVIHPVQQDITKMRDFDRDRLPFPSNSMAHLSTGGFHQSNSVQNANPFGQKQAQNLPNILRQDTPDKQKQLPNLSHVTNGTHQSHHDLAGAHNKGFATQFWNSKLGESTRVPAPAVSSNSAFNATLAQPGVSAAFIPPKTYSPAAQLQGTVFKPSPAMHPVGPTTSSSKAYQPLHSFPAQTASHVQESDPGSTTLFQPKTRQPSNGDDRILFGAVPPKQEHQQ